MVAATAIIQSNAAAAPAARAAGFALLFRVPDDELQEFWNLTPERQALVTTTFSLIEEIHQARNRRARALEIAGRHAGHACYSAKTLLNKHRLYVNGGYRSGVARAENILRPGDWKCLVPAYWLEEKKHHQGFVDYLARLAGAYQRDQGDAAALRELKMVRWPRGDAIPGYGTWREYFRKARPGEPVPAECPPDWWPEGWSNRTLYRRLPEAAHLALARHGVAAAEEHFAQIINDRTALHFGEVIIIDDFWAPMKVQYGREITYCTGLAAIDWASGAWVHHAIMPRETMPDGTRRSLGAAHMQWFVIGLLRKTGLPRDRTITLLVENNTASIGSDFEELIRQTFNGRVIVKRSGLLKGSEGFVLQHGFREGGGKWRADGKGVIESGFNLVKNEMSALPGQRGSKERTNGHAAFPAMEDYAARLLSNGAISDEDARLLKLPFLTYADAVAVVNHIFQRINGYRDHKCRGFEMVTEWRLSPVAPWSLYGDEPTPEQNALIAQGAQIITQTKPESRIMRARRLRAQMEWTPVPESAFIPLAASRFKKVTVTAKRQIIITRTGGDNWVFYSNQGVEDGLLTPGAEYRGFILDEEGAAIHLTPPDSLRHLGSVPRQAGVNPLDEEARSAAYKETCAPKRRALARVREVHAPEDAGLAAMRLHNAAVEDAARQGISMGRAAARIREQNKRQDAATQRRNATRMAQLAAAARAQQEAMSNT